MNGNYFTVDLSDIVVCCYSRHSDQKLLLSRAQSVSFFLIYWITLES